MSFLPILPVFKQYADESSRTSDSSLQPGDVGKLCRQLDNNYLYLLTDEEGPSWIRLLTDTGSQITSASVLDLTNTTQSTSSSSGSIISDGGIGVAKNIVAGGQTGSEGYSAGNSGSSLAVDWNNGNVQSVTLTNNCVFSFSNPIPGFLYTLILVQDFTGGRTVSYPANFLWMGGTPPTLTTTASAVDVVSFVYDGTNYHGNSGQFQGVDGSSSLPSYSFSSDLSTGIYKSGSGALGFTSAGSLKLEISGSSATASCPILTTDSTESSSPTTGSVKASGGISSLKNMVSGGQVASVRHASGNSGSSVTVDWNNGNVQSITLTGNATLTFSNPIDGAVYRLILTQDSTGERDVTWPATVKWSGGSPVLTTTAGSTDVVTLLWDGSSYYGLFSADFT